MRGRRESAVRDMSTFECVGSLLSSKARIEERQQELKRMNVCSK